MKKITHFLKANKSLVVLVNQGFPSFLFASSVKDRILTAFYILVNEDVYVKDQIMP